MKHLFISVLCENVAQEKTAEAVQSVDSKQGVCFYYFQICLLSYGNAVQTLQSNLNIKLHHHGKMPRPTLILCRIHADILKA